MVHGVAMHKLELRGSRRVPSFSSEREAPGWCHCHHELAVSEGTRSSTGRQRRRCYSVTVFFRAESCMLAARSHVPQRTILLRLKASSSSFFKKRKAPFIVGSVLEVSNSWKVARKLFKKKKGGDEDCHGDVQSIVGS